MSQRRSKGPDACDSPIESLGGCATTRAQRDAARAYLARHGAEDLAAMLGLDVEREHEEGEG